ncbi:MAG: DUF502 domain-containing protein [Arcobacteraceae bacterium]|jgi:uncharacterized membrane protein
MGSFFRYILIGALALVPLFVVVQIIMWAESIAQDVLEYLFIYTNNTFLSVGILIVILLFLAFIGSSIERVGKSLLVHFLDTTLVKIPAIGTIYGIVKKITELFKPNAKSERREVVLVEYPRIGLWVPAYVLNKHEDIWVLFIPTSPNPTSGYAIMVDKSLVKPTTLTISEASQFIVSMGADFIKKEELSVIIKEANMQNNK